MTRVLIAIDAALSAGRRAQGRAIADNFAARVKALTYPVSAKWADTSAIGSRTVPKVSSIRFTCSAII
jgi:hypothetical protein